MYCECQYYILVISTNIPHNTSCYRLHMPHWSLNPIVTLKKRTTLGSSNTIQIQLLLSRSEQTPSSSNTIQIQLLPSRSEQTPSSSNTIQIQLLPSRSEKNTRFLKHYSYRSVIVSTACFSTSLFNIQYIWDPETDRNVHIKSYKSLFYINTYELLRQTEMCT